MRTKSGAGPFVVPALSLCMVPLPWTRTGTLGSTKTALWPIGAKGALVVETPGNAPGTMSLQGSSAPCAAPLKLAEG